MEATKVRLEAVAYLPGTDGSNPSPSSGESANFQFLEELHFHCEFFLDPVTGAAQRRFEIAPGTEGIAFDNPGRLWAVSEAGSRHIYDHPFLGLFQPFFPLVFALDLSRLE